MKKQKHCPQQKKPCRGLKSCPDSQREAWSANAALIHFVWQRKQAHHAAPGVPGEHELSHHHDRSHLGGSRELRGNPVHHPDRLESLENEEKENEGKELAGGAVMKALWEPCPGAESERAESGFLIHKHQRQGCSGSPWGLENPEADIEESHFLSLQLVLSRSSTWTPDRECLSTLRSSNGWLL